MLVLSRKVGEEIRLVEAGVTIKLMDTKSSRAKIAIDAPGELTVLRGELIGDDRAAATNCSARLAIERLALWADSVDATQLSDELPVIDDLIERLIEVRLTARQSTGPATIRSNEIAQPTSVRSIGAYYRVEADVPSPAERLPKLHTEGFTTPGCECV